MPEGGGAGSDTIPELRAMAVQTERPIQGKIRVVNTQRSVFLHGFCDRVHQAPSRGFREVLVCGVLEFLEYRHNIARIDDAHFSRTDYAGTGIVIVLEILHLHILADGLGNQEFVLQGFDCTRNQFGQFELAGMTALNDHRAAKSQVRTHHDADPRCDTRAEALVVRVPDADRTDPVR